VELFTHLALRPDQITLYGLASRSALDLFELLVGVNGVGPKLALSVLSSFDPSDLTEIISRGDAQALSRAPGVGPRAASRIVSELGAKLKGFVPVSSSDSPGSYSQALAALIDLGYPLSEARQALESAPRDGSLEDMIRSGLGVLADQPGR
jgi:Holliday junction DNA helicase RuvA